jgi:monofunctional biosynthetic peptidoglycan transglycosylase
MKTRLLHKILSPAWIVAIIAAGLLLFLGYEALTWPDVSALKTRNPKTTAFIELYKQKQKKSGKKAHVSWKWVPYDEISPELKRAVLVAEDISFFQHHGFDFAELNDALKEALKEKEKPRGASTVSQQVVKNLWLSPSRSYLRKLKEAILTVQLERTLKKRRILEIYLNIAEFAPGVFGAEAASRYFFKKHASELDEQEAAELAASLPKPEAWHPGSKSTYYKYRVELIFRRMQTHTFINKYL